MTSSIRFTPQELTGRIENLRKDSLMPAMDGRKELRPLMPKDPASDVR